MPTLDDAYFQRVETLKAAGVDPHGSDDTALGVAFVYCHQHCRAHGTGWCTVSNADKTPLEATDETTATAEARDRGFWIYGDPRPCTHGCGAMVDLDGKDTTTGETRCADAPRTRPWHTGR